MKRKLVIFIDSGDTLIDEGAELKDERGVVYSAKLIEGAGETLKSLYEQGHTIALVADGYEESFNNIYRENGLENCFHTRAISELVGTAKPSARMFETAMRNLGLTEADKKRIIMVGNNIERDVHGANKFGITSVLLNWTPRYRMVPANEYEVPKYTISKPIELLELVNKLEAQLADELSA
jgi:FMN phosphatase YigB (HAD superfamily)